MIFLLFHSASGEKPLVVEMKISIACEKLNWERLAQIASQERLERRGLHQDTIWSHFLNKRWKMRVTGESILPSAHDSKSMLLALLDIPPLSITKCHPHSDRHDSQRWHQKDHHAFTDSFSPILRRCRGRAAAHGAPLSESGRSPQKEKHGKNGKLTSHFTPR